MEAIEEQYERLEDGIQKLLGKVSYGEPEPIKECVHISDGFIYDDTPMFMTLQCAKCNLQYDVNKITGLIM